MMKKNDNSKKARWINYLNSEVDFYLRSSSVKRIDSDFPWEWFEKKQKLSTVKLLIKRVKFEKLARQLINLSRSNTIVYDTMIDRINKNTDNIWEARSLLKDELSKIMFDRVLVMRSVGENKYYFPRSEFEEIAQILDIKDFDNSELPNNYSGLPLKIFDLYLKQAGVNIKIISTQAGVDLMNNYHQYLLERNKIRIRPEVGDTVLDCGACIHEISIIFASLVGVGGGVHCFDPIPLHVRYGKLQAEMNPSFSEALHFNTLAVGDKTFKSSNKIDDFSNISPGGLNSDSFDMMKLDDYVVAQNLNNVDFIKMDIEGYEMDALNGAHNLVKEFKPKLAISGYHRFEDLWEIPFKIKDLNPNYDLFFAHHSPIKWESVFYASDSN
jgi:FkbM family methyltransferase